jgi:sporulation protein YlmC with PRC-barrel domain
MDIEYGAEVIDRNGKYLGTVDHLMHNTWTGEISKFVIRRKAPERDLFVKADEVLEAGNTRIKLNVSFDELSQNI